MFTRKKIPVAIDLFSGCGGLTQGLKDAGFRVIGAVELDSLAVSTYKLNHKSTKVWKCDIRSLKPGLIKKFLKLRKGQLDLLAGCPPCQGFSRLRTKNNKPVRDERNTLIEDFLIYSKELMPKCIMLENVPGLTKYWKFNIFRRELTNLGYSVKYKVVNSRNYNVPQRRNRLILIASRIGDIEFPVPSNESVTVRDAISHLPDAGKSGDPAHDHMENRSRKVRNIIRNIPKDGGSRSDLGKNKQLKCHQKIDGFKDIYGRMKWNDVSPTITGGCSNPSKGRFLHPVYNRTITIREAAILQGFSIDYKIDMSAGKGKAAQIIGNAIPPALVKQHAVQIKSKVC